VKLRRKTSWREISTGFFTFCWVNVTNENTSIYYNPESIIKALIHIVELGLILIGGGKYMNNYEVKVEELELLSVKESNEKRVPAKRVDIVSLRLVKETSLLYKDRAIRSPEDGYNLFKQFLGELDREYFVVMCLEEKSADSD